MNVILSPFTHPKVFTRLAFLRSDVNTHPRHWESLTQNCLLGVDMRFLYRPLQSSHLPAQIDMKNRLKEYRKLRNLTQEELADFSGISIRTIQRIESGLTSGSPYTIKSLAKFLGVENSDLLATIEIKRSSQSDDKLKLMNFCVFAVWLIPFGNIIIPAIVFLKNRGIENVYTTGSKILSFQILSLLILPLILIALFLLIGRGPGQIPIPVGISYLTYGLVNSLFTIHNAIQINRKKEILSFVPNIF